MPEEQSRLAALQRYGRLDGASEATDTIVRVASYVCGTPIAGVGVVEAERQVLLSSVGLEVTETPREIAFCAHTILGDDVMVVPDAATDVRFARNPLVTGPPGIRFYASAPIRTGDGHAIGGLWVGDRKPRELGPEQLQILRDLAAQVMVALELRRHTQIQADELEASETRLRLALEAGRMGTWDWSLTERRLEMSPMLESVYGLAPGTFSGDEEEFLALIHPDDRDAAVGRIVQAVEEGSSWESEHRAVLADGTVRWIWGKGRVVTGPDGELLSAIGVAMDVTDRHQAEEAVRAREERFRALVQDSSDVILVIDRQGRTTYESPAVERMLGYRVEDRLGQRVFDIVHPDQRTEAEHILARLAHEPGGEWELRLRLLHADGSWRHVEGVVKNRLADPAVAGIVVNYRDVTERRTLEERLRHQASHDPLTGLADRVLFRERLELALARPDGALHPGICFVDLDDFKAVNDSGGHSVGDQVLRAVAWRLEAAAREDDVVARLGGDEFAVLLEGVSVPAEAEAVALRILDVLASPVRLEDREVTVGASVGVAVAEGRPVDAEQLLGAADRAMYRAKADGKGRHHLVLLPSDAPPAEPESSGGRPADP